MSYYKPVTTIASVSTPSTPVPVTIASATEPTTRPNGGTLRQGDNWYNTSTSADYIWIENDGETNGGSWKIIGSGAGGPSPDPGGGGGDFTGGFVQSSIFVGGNESNPNLSLLNTGGIIAEQTIQINTPTTNGVSFVVKDLNETTGLRILGNGTLQIGKKTGDIQSLLVGVQLNPAGTIELGGATLEVKELDSVDTLYINNDPIISATTLNTGNVDLTNPTTVTGSSMLTRFNVSTLSALPPIDGLSTQEDYNQWTFSAVDYLDLNKIDEAPEDGLTYGRNNGSWNKISGITPKGTVATAAELNNVANPQNGDLYVVVEDGHGYIYESGSWVDIGDIRGPQGPPGPDGEAATVTVGSTSTGEAGTDASVINSGSTSNAIFDFTIPQGAKGDTGDTGDDGTPGDPGDPGDAATVTVGSTTTGAAGTNASVTNDGSTSQAIFSFTIPQGVKGDTGDTGDDGNDGDPGDAATITVGTTITGEAGTSALVVNSGDTSEAVFDFTIPQGDKGDTGDTGDDGNDGDPGDAATITVGTTSTLSSGSNATVTNVGTTSEATFDFGIPQGIKGDKGDPGDAATVNVGSTTTGAAGSLADVTNSGGSSAAIFNFVIPQGEKGDKGDTGEDGTSISLSGTVPTINDLPTQAPAGTMYIVQFDGNGYVSDGASPTSEWTDVGKIQGPEGPEGPAGPVGGSDTQILFNDNGTCSGASDLTFDSNTLSTNKIVTTGDITIESGGFFVGDGSKLTGISIPNSFEFQGDTDVTGTAPTLAIGDAGYFYLNTVAGVADSSWTGVSGSTFVKDQTIFWDGSSFFAGAEQSNNTALQLIGGTMTGDIVFAGTQTFPSTGLPDASTTQKGIVELSNSIVSDSETIAPTLKAIKTVADSVSVNAGNISTLETSVATNTENISSLTTSLGTTDGNVAQNTTDIVTATQAASAAQSTADSALPKSGGTMTGNIKMDGTTVIEFNDSQTFPSDIPVDPSQLPDATINQKGVVQLTNDKESVSETLAPTSKALSETYDTAAAAQTTANAALPKLGGTMTGDIVFADTQTFPQQVPDISDLPVASINEAGIVQLSDAIDSDSIVLAGTANSVASAYDRGTLGITNAATAQSAAETADDKAVVADAKADTAQLAAVAAQSSADDAQADATSALTIANLALPKAGGIITGSLTAQSDVTFQSEVVGVQTTGSSLDASLVTKKYVDDQVADADGDVESVSAGNGLTGLTIDKDNPTGSFAVLADGDSISVGANGIKVDETKLTFPVTSVNGEIGEVVLSASDVNAIGDNNGVFTGTLNGVNVTLSGDLDSNTLDVTTDATVGGTLDITGVTTATTIDVTDITATGTVIADAFVGDGSALTGLPTSGAAMGSLPPTNPESGDLWYNDNIGILYVYYVDADSSQWVDSSPTISTTNVTNFKVNLLSTVTASTDLATLKAAIINALAYL